MQEQCHALITAHLLYFAMVHAHYVIIEWTIKSERPKKNKILIVNPNTTSSFTDLIRARTLHFPNLSVDCVQPNTGPKSIEGHFDDILSAQPTLELIQDHVAPGVSGRGGGYDAVVIACISDHAAIYPAREILEIPVVGILEASVIVASQISNKFAIVTSNRRWEPLLEEAVTRYGYSAKCVAVKSCLDRVLDLEQGDGSGPRERVKLAAEEAMAEGAEAIILGCCGMAGLKEELENYLKIPVIDPIDAGIMMASTLVDLNLKTSKANYYSVPAWKPAPGISDELTKAYCAE